MLNNLLQAPGIRSQPARLRSALLHASGVTKGLDSPLYHDVFYSNHNYFENWFHCYTESFVFSK